MRLAPASCSRSADQCLHHQALQRCRGNGRGRLFHRPVCEVAPESISFPRLRDRFWPAASQRRCGGGPAPFPPAGLVEVSLDGAQATMRPVSNLAAAGHGSVLPLVAAEFSGENRVAVAGGGRGRQRPAGRRCAQRSTYGPGHSRVRRFSADYLGARHPPGKA
jgi:hypothetical protein